MNLTHSNLRFVAEYLASVPRNATAAYMRVYGCGYESANASAGKLLSNPEIKAEIARREEMLRKDLALTAEDVIREIFLVASADPRELTEHYRGACRFCHGADHQYQRRQSEFDCDLAAYLKANKQAVKKGEAQPDPLGLLFPVLGGVGFSTKRDPHPNCPECDGVGVSYEYFKDTRNLSPAAARLFEGVKKTKDGLEIKIRDREKSLAMAAQHLGLVRSKVELTGRNGGPIQAITAGVSLAGTDATTAAQIYQNLVGGGA